MANDAPKQGGELIRQISKAWEAAQSQLRELRQSVEFASQLAKAQSESTTFTRDRDKAFRTLGEAVWGEVTAGRLQLPPHLSGPLQAVQDAERRATAAAASITELLRETEDMTRRPKGGPAPAPPPKGKRR